MGMSAQPMLDDKEMEVPVARAIVLEGEQMSKYDAKAASLRRACAALLLFSILSSHPWPSAGWIGIVAGLLVLCSTSEKLLCRARAARFLSAVVAIFASIAIVTIVTSIYANKPQRIGAAISSHCVSMPADTFQWMRTIVSEHECAQKGLAFLSRHVQHKDDDRVALSNATELAMLVGTAPAWSQPEACDKIARVSACVVKMMMVGSVITHLFLLLSAAAVIKRACCLRCFACKCGLLKLSNCGAGKCQYASKPTATVIPMAKELE